MHYTPLEGAEVGSLRAGGVAGVEEPIDFGLATSGILGDAFSAGDFGAAEGGLGCKMKTTIVSIKTEGILFRLTTVACSLPLVLLVWKQNLGFVSSWHHLVLKQECHRPTSFQFHLASHHMLQV